MTRIVAALRSDERAASAAEFGLVLPLLIFLLFGIIDAGRFLWVTNKAEKATQMGARYAVVTDVIPAALVNATYVGSAACSERAATGNICQTGDFVDIPAALGTLTCTRAACNCSGSCPANASIDTAAFDRLVARMATMKPGIGANNVQVVFRGSGIGYAGDPNGMEVVPLVTVRLTGIQFRPVALLGAVGVNLPSFATTLSAEDSAGTQAN